MKKLLLITVMSLTFSGSMLAQRTEKQECAKAKAEIAGAEALVSTVMSKIETLQDTLGLHMVTLRQEQAKLNKINKRVVKHCAAIK